MENNVESVAAGPLPKEQRRQLFLIGLGMYGAVLFINLAFLVTFESSPSRYASVRILAPVLTVVFTVVDTALLRVVSKKQYPEQPDLLARWPVKVTDYPTWVYSAFVALSCATSAYLLTRI